MADLSWQANAETNRICAIAIGTEGEMPDYTGVNLGGNLDWTDNASGGEADGYTALMDLDQTGATRPLYLTEDDIKRGDLILNPDRIIRVKVVVIDRGQLDHFAA